jgi:hypothetical protein
MQRIPRAAWALGLIAGLLLLVVGWSMLTETLLPLARAGAYAELALNCLGLPILIAGIAVFVWGGLFFAGHTYALMDTEAFGERAIRLRARETPRDERRILEHAQLRSLWQAWRPGLAWLLLGAGFISLGSLIINWLPRWFGLAQ